MFFTPFFLTPVQHAVYNSAGLPGANRTKEYLDRQGELFTYMHTGMMARYNADRLSWGLPLTVAYDLEETEPLGFWHSEEFHSARLWGRGPFGPRPAGRRWPDSAIQRFQAWVKELRVAVRRGFIMRPSMSGGAPERVPLTANWFGHVLEATTSTFRDELGNIHNSGHGVFGSMVQLGHRRGVMNSSVGAIRDPIFYRWHSFVDALVEEYGNSRATELASDTPPVAVDAVVVKRYQRDAVGVVGDTASPPAGFAEFSGGAWARPAAEYGSDTMYTTLAPPEHEWEFGKLCGFG